VKQSWDLLDVADGATKKGVGGGGDMWTEFGPGWGQFLKRGGGGKKRGLNRIEDKKNLSKIKEPLWGVQCHVVQEKQKRNGGAQKSQKGRG